MKYQIVGQPLTAVICDLEPGEAMITERGSMAWMTPNMKMETKGGGIGKAFSRMFAGEALFQNIYTAMNGPGQITFATSFPGSIMPVVIEPGRDMIVQKCGFLAGTSGIDISIHFQKRFSSGLFGGEGFIMQRLSGQGTAFIEIDGYACEYTLAPGQSMIVDTGYLAMMESTCTMEVVTVPGIKNMLFGGEGIFNTKVTGPGKIVLQTMPVHAVAGALRPYLPSSGE